jgi:hypothetical protein
MSNSIFVSEEQDTFDISAYYTKEGEFKVYKPAELSDEDKATYSQVTIKFVIPDYAKCRAIMRQSTVYMGGNSTIDYSVLQNSMFEVLVKDWDLKTEEGEKIPFSFEKLSRMRPDIARCFVEQLVEKLTDEGVYDSMLVS